MTLANLLPPTLMTCHSSYLKKCFVSMQSELQNLLTKPDQWNQNNLHFLQFRCYWNLIQHDGNIINCWTVQWLQVLCEFQGFTTWDFHTYMFCNNRTHSKIKFGRKKDMFLRWLNFNFFSWFVATKNLVTWLCRKIFEGKLF